MKKTVLASAIALSLATSISAPAYAAERQQEQVEAEKSATDSFSSNPIWYYIALLLPAVQTVRG